MGFLTPWFLAGVAAVSIPIYVHLLRQNKAQPLPFSSLMLLERRTESSLKQRRLRYLLLFALRTALVCLLALAFAGPYLQHQANAAKQGAKTYVIAVDQSYSMRQNGALAKAKQDAVDAVNLMRPGDRGIVVSLGSEAHMLTQPIEEKDALRNAIQSIEQTDARATYAEVSRVARDVARNTKLPVEAHLCSDLQQSAMPPQFNDLEMPQGSKLIFHPSTSGAKPNWYVETVIAPTIVYGPTKRKVQATVAGTNSTSKTATVLFVLNGRTLESKQAIIPASGRTTVDFSPVEFPYGLNKGEIRIEANDALPDDDHYWFPVERAEPRRILFLTDGRSNRAQLYYQSALESSPDNAFALDVSTPSAAMNANFQKYAFVALSDVGALPPGFQDMLTRYVKNGGALLIAAGPAMAGQSRVPVLDADVLGPDYASRSGDRFQTATSVDAEHPATKKTGRWEGVRFFQAVKIEPGKAAVLARLSDGTPALMERKVGDGRVMVFASTFDNVANDFPLHSSFVPFIEQSAQFLAGMSDKLTRFPVDSFFELRAARDQGASVEVTGPDGRRALSLAESATAQSLPLARVGFYEVRRSNGRQEMIAANADRRESDLQPLAKETLALWQNTGQANPQEGGPGSTGVTRTPLWPYLLLALLCVAVAESVLASRFTPTERESG